MMNKIFFLILFFSLSVLAGQPDYMSSLILINRDNNQVIGSASHICNASDQNSMGFITAAHVVEGVKNIEAVVFSEKSQVSYRRKLDKVLVDSSKDLALLKSDRNLFDFFLPCFGGPLISNLDLDLPESFDILTSTSQDKFRLEIEGYDSETKDIKTEVVIAPLVKSIQSGLPGRDNVGQLYMSQFKVKPGFSGGIVLGYAIVDNYIRHTPDTNYKWSITGPRRTMIGIVTAADPVHGRVAIIPFSTINWWIADNIYKVNNTKINENIINTLNGVYDKNLSALILQPTQSLKSVGLSSYGGVGTGRPAVGDAARSQDLSGLIAQVEKDKRWLSLGDNWVEGDPLSLKAREQIAQNNLNGIFVNTDGSFQKTTGAVFPKILNKDQLSKALGADLNSECLKTQFQNIQTQRRIDVNLCEKISVKQAEYQINSTEFKYALKLNQSDSEKIEVMAMINDKSVNSVKSLRRAQNEDLDIKIEGLSGIEINDKKSGQTWIGPIK